MSAAKKINIWLEPRGYTEQKQDQRFLWIANFGKNSRTGFGCEGRTQAGRHRQPASLSSNDPKLELVEISPFFWYKVIGGLLECD